MANGSLSLPLSEVLQRIVDRAGVRLGSDVRLGVRLWQGGSLVTVANAPGGAGDTGEAGAPRGTGGAADAPGGRSWTLPLEARGEGLGELTVSRPAGAPPLRTEDEGYLAEVAEWASLAVDNHRLLAGVQALERASPDVQQFAYIVSHDLKEPLRMVSSWLGLLMRRHGDRLVGEPAEFVGYALSGATRMRELLEGLLAYSRVGAEAHPATRVDLERALAEVESDLHGLIAEHGAFVTHAPLPPVRADPVQVRQLLQNLLTNALKFRGDDPPRVEWRAERRDGQWRLSISDNGIGIPPEAHARIFQLFERLHRPEDYPGTGVGLAICSRIVERHGGEIGVESTPGRGATFWFTLPAADAPGSA